MPQILTPTGPRAIDDCQIGDVVLSADSRTGRRLLNRITDIQRVDEREWERWHQGPDVKVPNFLDYDINGGDIKLFGEQSIFHNNGAVTHAKHLRPGHVIFRDGKPVRVKRTRQIDGKPWHRLEIDGDHSYIGDALRLHNSSRFWVGGTGTWDLSATTHWASSTGGSSGASAPSSADSATFDGSSGGGTVTPSYGGTGTFQSITCGAFTGTIDWSVNSNSVTLSAATGLSGTGSGTRTINLGNGTWTISVAAGGSTIWNFGTTTNLTFSANSSTIAFTGNLVLGGAATGFSGGGLTYSTITCAAQTGGGAFQFNGANTFSALTVTGSHDIYFNANHTITTLTLNGTSSKHIGVQSATVTTARTLTVTTLSAAWCAFRDIAMSGSGLTATNSLDLGDNSGFTITAPSSAGVSGSRIFSGM